MTLSDQERSTVLSLRRQSAVDLTVIMPIFDEEESIPRLLERLFDVLDGLALRYEVVAVNDGSSDHSIEVLHRIAVSHPELRVLDFRRNYGQTAALMAGFDNARGDIIVTIDADLQNDPADIPRLIDKINEGYDVVSGWRVDRKDAAITRNLLSRVANTIISRVSGVKLRDYGCTLKAYRRDIISNVRLYGEMHRFIPIYASWMGARVVELPVNHNARQFGRSKYGMDRIFKVVLDLLVLKFLERYLVKPIYVFGGFGLVAMTTSFAVLGWAIALRLFAHTSLIQTPLPLLAAMLFLIGCVSILMGLLAEITTRTYFESQGGRAYQLRDRASFGPPA